MYRNIGQPVEFYFRGGARDTPLATKLLCKFEKLHGDEESSEKHVNGEDHLDLPKVSR